MAGKSLVIVESSAKARTINKYLGNQYKIEASSGHIMDLPKKELGVEINGGFKPKYVVISGKSKILKKFEGLVTKSDQVYLALDPDREGEAIAWFLAEKLELPPEKIKRVLFYEITRESVKNAMEQPGKIDMKKVNAQQARRILDRLVGYKISPILWKTIKPGISAGRVQTVALRLICEREQEIAEFKPKEYWTIHAHLLTEKGESVEAALAKIEGKDPEISNSEEADKIVSSIGEGPFVISDIERKSRKKNPNPPFITSTLQQDASRKLGFSASRTMSIAQSLYEGVDLDKERRAGLITYMRTDSVRMASSAVQEARSWISEQYGEDYLPGKPRGYKSKRRVQDAHEAIRPTSVLRTPDSVKKYLNNDQFRLYELIWKRFIACQMNPAVYDVTLVSIPVREFLFRASGSILRFPGYLAVQGIEEIDRNGNNGKVLLPDLSEGEELSFEQLEPKQHYTQPPPRYSEGSLIKELESRDIGRPSTYATIVATLKNRNYIRVEKKRFVPGDLGKVVNGVLVGSFPEIFELEFTQRMESELDRVENGELGWQEILQEFYEPFSKSLEMGENISEQILKDFTNSGSETCEKCGKNMVIKWTREDAFLACPGYPECRNIRPLYEKEPVSTDEVCPKCQSPLQVKSGRYGSFLACPAYPDCRFTKKLHSDDSPEEPPREEKCDLCGGEMLLKRGRFGRFLACNNYPDCKGTKPFTIGVTCPEDNCGGELIERKGKKGKVFYGCSNYPNCKFASWNIPKPIKCTSCNFPFSTAAGKSKPGHYKCLKCASIFASEEEVTSNKQ
jgi:DNA topoisomerase-1